MVAGELAATGCRQERRSQTRSAAGRRCGGAPGGDATRLLTGGRASSPRRWSQSPSVTSRPRTRWRDDAIPYWDQRLPCPRRHHRRAAGEPRHRRGADPADRRTPGGDAPHGDRRARGHQPAGERDGRGQTAASRPDVAPIALSSAAPGPGARARRLPHLNGSVWASIDSRKLTTLACLPGDASLSGKVPLAVRWFSSLTTQARVSQAPLCMYGCTA
jgi:hypothetical protein